jgi:Lon protease-like protein
MPGPDDFTFDPESFGGMVRLFPLPNLVMFPHVVQPLHIFEPRYREMMRDALAGDRLIAMAMLAPGWEKDYDGRPPLEPVACLGRVAAHHEMEDGKFNLLLIGVARLKILEELPPDRSYRRATAVLLADAEPASGEPRRNMLQGRLRAAFKARLIQQQHASQQLEQLLGADMSLGTLTDLIGYTLDFDLNFKLQLLGEVDVDRRAELLLHKLQSGELPAQTLTPRSFPPDFSDN